MVGLMAATGVGECPWQRPGTHATAHLLASESRWCSEPPKADRPRRNHMMYIVFPASDSMSAGEVGIRRQSRNDASATPVFPLTDVCNHLSHNSLRPYASHLVYCGRTLPFC